MYIAYSALKNEKTGGREPIEDPTTQIRYRAYQQVCEKHKREIAQIQQYLPGWFPKFDYTTKY